MTDATDTPPAETQSVEQRIAAIVRDLDAGYEGIGAEDVRFLLSQLDASQRALAEAQKDVARLDWLEREIGDPSPAQAGQGIYVVPTETDKWRWHDCSTGTEHASFREAIDAAMSASPLQDSGEGAET